MPVVDTDLTDDKKTIIRNTALAILKNGTSFLDWLMARRKGEATYDFLFGGNGSEFYNWCLLNPAEATQLETVKQHVIDNCLPSDIPRLQLDSMHPKSYSVPRSESSYSESSHSSYSRRRSRRYRSRSRSPSLITRDRRCSRSSSRHRNYNGQSHIRGRSISPSPGRLRERMQRADWVRQRREERENRRRHEVSPRQERRRGKMYAWSSSSEDGESSKALHSNH